MAVLMQTFPKIKVNGQYVLKEKIGQGSFGQVFKGMHQWALSIHSFTFFASLIIPFTKYRI